MNMSSYFLCVYFVFFIIIQYYNNMLVYLNVKFQYVYKDDLK